MAELTYERCLLELYVTIPDQCERIVNAVCEHCFGTSAAVLSEMHILGLRKAISAYFEKKSHAGHSEGSLTEDNSPLDIFCLALSLIQTLIQLCTSTLVPISPVPNRRRFE